MAVSDSKGQSNGTSTWSKAGFRGRGAASVGEFGLLLTVTIRGALKEQFTEGTK